MLRFYDTDFIEEENIRRTQDALILDNAVWNACRNIVRKCSHYHNSLIHVIPIENKEKGLAAYGYQDNEANRELRMLRELVQCKNALQFGDIFSEYKEVVICGCNELAVSFAEYLTTLGVRVSVAGKYWEYFGYCGNDTADFNGEGKLVVFAEGVIPRNGSLTQAVRNSVSPEFECIDKIYEANVLDGRIRDTMGSFEDLIGCLAGEQEVVILGDGRESQDAYDLLLSFGIDICGFAVEKKTRSRLLGKAVMDVDEAVKCLGKPVFVECHGRNGALGGEDTEYFDYRGYERNKQFFMIRDYTDIPVSNLVHALRGKNVILTGDRRLCQLLTEYLSMAGDGNIFAKYVEIGGGGIRKNDIVCVVVPDYYTRPMEVRDKKNMEYKKFLSDAGENPAEILRKFWEMYDEESVNKENDFPDQKKFDMALGRLLRLKESFTAQELFVIFHAAYVEMLGVQMPDICGQVIYWEPHFVPRYDFPFLAEWLREGRINVQTIELRRNNVVRTGSACARVTEHQLTPLDPFYNMFLDESSWGGQDEDDAVLKMRFEDIKLHPMEMLDIVCKRMDIAWSDRMLKTTSCGQVSSYRGSTDFDLKSVFNKYDDFLSEFDRFRISIACSPYLKRYGYTFENCLRFSRRELQEMFRKPFMFESDERFQKDGSLQMKLCEWIKWQLWEVRKHMVLDDIRPEFGQVEIK